MRVATFNVQNLRLRRGDGGPLLDAAQDRMADDIASIPAAERIHDRELTAQVIAESRADIIMLQEVFDLATLDYFHERFLVPLAARYPHRACLEGNDGRSEDVAVLSKLPLQRITSHAAMTYDEIGAAPPPGETGASRVFRRDCLACLCGSIWLFGCHFKVADGLAARDRTIRRAEALAVRRIIEHTTENDVSAQWLALGDFNLHDTADQSDIRVLLEPFSADLTRTMAPGDRWTYARSDDGARSCPDRILSSPVLKQRIKTPPQAIRLGLPSPSDIGQGEKRSPRASDHALLWIDLNER